MGDRDALTDELRWLLREAEECLETRPDLRGVEAAVAVEPTGAGSTPILFRWGKVGGDWRLTIGDIDIDAASRSYAIAAATHLPLLRNKLVSVARELDASLERAVRIAREYLDEERVPNERDPNP